ncbi:MAG: hypothetical protein ACE5G1_13065, partial [bacterium]
MEKHQDDLPSELASKDQASPINNRITDRVPGTRESFAENLPLDDFFSNQQERTFASLGRVATIPEKGQPWKLSPESREKIHAHARNGRDGSPTLPDEYELSPTDLLSIAAEGSKLSDDKLQQSTAL